MLSEHAIKEAHLKFTLTYEMQYKFKGAEIQVKHKYINNNIFTDVRCITQKDNINKKKNIS